MQVYVWPDYSWMDAEDYNETEDACMGDDFCSAEVPDTMAPDDIETYLRAEKVQDFVDPRADTPDPNTDE